MGGIKIHSNIKKEELVKKRQNQVYEAASKLFVKNGFHGTTIRDIARESGLGVGPIYDYFKNKEEILFLVQKRVVELTYEKTNESLSGIEDPKEKLIKAIETQVNLFDENQDLFLFIYKEGHLLDRPMKKEIMNIERRTISLFEEILKAGQDKKVFGKFDVKIAANMIILINHGWVLKRWDLKSTKESQTSFTIDFVLKAISL
jgi:AcrR family transcriptional regulator